MSEGEEVLLAQFFVNTTYVCSGAETKTRVLGKLDWEWEMQLYSWYPSCLRALCRVYPAIVPDVKNPPKGGWTEFQASLLSARAAGEAKDFDEKMEKNGKNGMCAGTA